MSRGEGRAGRHTVLLAKPERYMNRSGDAFRALLAEGWVAGEILVVCDEVYLPLGALRMPGAGIVPQIDLIVEKSCTDNCKQRTL
jgi:peptidyl-tRNA hydrolase